MRVVIFGGTGPTGKLVVDKGLEARLSLRVLARTPAKLPERPGLEVVQGDALNGQDVAAAIEGMDAVVCTLGVPYSFKAITLYSEAAAHILSGMEQHGVRRLVAVTSGGTHPGRDPNPPWFFEYLLKPIIGRTLYADMRRMEALIAASSVDWTVLRPSRLMDRDPVGPMRSEIGAYTLPGGDELTRGALAEAIVHHLQSSEAVGEGVAISE